MSLLFHFTVNVFIVTVNEKGIAIFNVVDCPASKVLLEAPMKVVELIARLPTFSILRSASLAIPILFSKAELVTVALKSPV